MADIKISGLNQLTISALNDVVAIVDDSAVETKKITKENLLDGAGHTLNLASMTNSTLIAGSGNTITSAGGNAIYDSSIIGGNGNSIGGAGNTIGDCGWGGIFAGQNNNINGGGESRGQVIVGGYGNQLIGGGYLAGIYSSESSSISAQKSVVIGGGSHNIQGGYEHGILAGAGNSIASGEKCAIIASNGVSMNGYTIRDIVMGTEGGGITDSRFSNILGGYASSINTSANFQTIINSNAQITSSSERNLIINAPNGNITSGTNGALISTSNVNITGGNFNATLNVQPTSAEDITGINGATFISVFDTMTGNDWHDNTLHTDNIHTYKAESFQVVNVGNVGGSIDVDCSLGTIFTFTLTADTTPNFINLRNGQRFIFIVYNNGSWAVPGALLNGATGNVYAKNGTISPSNNGYSKYTATFDGTRMFLDEEVNFSAV